MTEGFSEPVKFKVKEHVVLKKFDGDFTDDEIEAKNPQPIEQLVIEDGKIITHTFFDKNGNVLKHHDFEGRE